MEKSRDASDDVHPQRVVDDDGATVEVFALPTDSASLEELLIGLFRDHWRQIAFGPLIQGSWRNSRRAPERGSGCRIRNHDQEFATNGATRSPCV